MLTSLLLSLALSAAPASKLGPHVSVPGTPGARALLAPCPRVAKWIAGPAANLDLATFRIRCPASTTVLRVEVGLTEPYYPGTTTATTAADDYWRRMSGHLAGLDPVQVDWLEGPNGTEAAEWTSDLNGAKWYADFLSRLADKINGAGYHPLLGAVPTGAMVLDGERGQNSPNLFAPIAEALKAKTYAWGWSSHAYSHDLTFDPSVENSQSLRYRALRDRTKLAGRPLILTEGGQGPSFGWQTLDTPAETYLDWLAWFDERLREDEEVLGVALFQVGDTKVKPGFELTPLAAELAELIAAPAPDGGSSTDAGRDAGRPGRDAGGSGSVGPGPGLPPGPQDAGGYSGYTEDTEEPTGCGCEGTGSSALLMLGTAVVLTNRRRS